MENTEVLFHGGWIGELFPEQVPIKGNQAEFVVPNGRTTNKDPTVGYGNSLVFTPSGKQTGTISLPIRNPG